MTINRPQHRCLERALCLLLLLLVPGAGVAQVPLGNAFTYQGRLEQGGTPATGSFDFEFRLYDEADPVTGTLIGSVTRLSVPVSGGLFTTDLDFGAAAFSGEARWLEIHVKPAGSGSFTALSPLQPVTAAPNALWAANADSATNAADADKLDGLDSASFLRTSGGTMSGNLFTNGNLITNGNITANGPVFTDELCLAGQCRTSWSSISGVDLSTNQAIDGTKTFLNRIFASEGMTLGSNVEGTSLDLYTSGIGLNLFRVGGLQFGDLRTNSGNDFILRAPNGKLRTQGDLYLRFSDTSSWLSLYTGEVNASRDIKFLDSAGATVGRFVISTDDVFYNDDMGGDFQVRTRFHVSGNGTEYMTFGTTNSYNIFFEEGPFSARDLTIRLGEANNGTLRIRGSLAVDGTVTKSGGSFRIDHPLDPENKYLYHSFVESPDMMNVYNGNVVTDENGEAVVQLPTYFEALNRDFRYQLTCIGTFARAMIAREVEGNTFLVKTDQPNVKVSWQVTGIRQDDWANANRLIPEVEKSLAEQGLPEGN